MLLDVLVALDAVNHSALQTGFVGLRIEFSSFSAWFQSVLDDGERSFPKLLICCRLIFAGYFSPLLFNIYMKPLGEDICQFAVHDHHIFLIISFDARLTK